MGKILFKQSKWLNKRYLDSALSETMVKRWYADFKHGCTNINDAEHSGCPNLVVAPKNIKKFHKIAEELKISEQHNKKFLHKYVTMNETWIHHFTQKSNQQSVKWAAAGESRPKRPKMQTSAGKVLASVFWDVQAILFTDYLKKRRTINSEYHIALLVYLKEKMTKKWPQMKKKKVLFHQDNAPRHKSIAIMAKLYELHLELLPHPPYSPDLVPSDCLLFVASKECSRERNLAPMK